MTIPSHASFKGTVLFQNVFDGKLPAADYPKIRVGVPANGPSSTCLQAFILNNPVSSISS